MPVEEDLRELVRKSDQSRYVISRQTGIAESQLSRFLNGQSLRAEVLETLADHLGHKIVLQPKPKSG